MKKVLVACEESQRVCISFREKGFEAYSCDILECSGGHPEWHIKGDVTEILSPMAHWTYISEDEECTVDIRFTTMDGKPHVVDKWDLIIAHPPCTNLCSAGQHWFTRGIKDPNLRDEAVMFFMNFVYANCEHIAIENPIGIMSTRYRKPDQIIQPYEYGHPETKKTCLWLKDLPELTPTNMLEKPDGGWKNQCLDKNGHYGGFATKDENGKWLRYNDPKTATLRSKTYWGIARAMADQWGDYLSTL